MSKRAAAVLLLIIVCGVGWLTAVSIASAHAVPVISNPQPNEILEVAPAELVIEFNEPVVFELSQIVVLTAAGETLDTGALRVVDDAVTTLAVDLPADTPNGAYLVNWRVLSAVDGHTTSGSFSFGVGDVVISATAEEVTIAAQISPLSAASRWLTLTGVALLLGFFSLRVFVWNPIFRGVDLAATDEAVNEAHLMAGLNGAAVGLGLVALGVLLVFIDQNQTYSLLQGSNFSSWVSNRFGRVWLLRVLVVALGGGGLFAAFSLVENGRYRAIRWVVWGGFLVSLLLASSVSLISHSAALLEGSLGASLVDLGHTVGASIWVGGLLYLAIGLHQSRSLPDEDRSWLQLSLILNFSALAAISVGGLLASGVYLASVHINSWTKLVGTAYGQVLLVKILVGLPAFGLAGYNLLFVKPRLRRAYAAPETDEAQKTMGRFGRLVWVETAVALLVLVGAGILTDLQRGIDAPLLSDTAGRTVLTETSEDVTIDVAIEPALVGPNRFRLTVLDENGELLEADDVSLRFTYLDQSLGSAEADADLAEDGSYIVEGSYISLIGGWQIEVSVRRPGVYDVFVPYRVDAGLGGEIIGAGTEIRPLEAFASFMTLASSFATGVLLIIVALFWGFIVTRAAKTSWQLAPMLLGTILIIMFGSQQLFTFFEEEYTPTKFLTNPQLPDSQSVAIGESLYRANCVSCHGEEGLGNGPLAASLASLPANFADGHTDTHPDGDLFYWIQNGVEGTPMPAFSDTISREESWHLVNYIRRLSVQGQTAVSQPVLQSN